jgi:RNA polymerase sigma-70 factor (ECF subfamily)
VNTFDITRDGLTWVLTLATWECRTARRRRRRGHLAEGVPSEAVDPSLDPEESAASEEALRLIEQWALQLPRDQQETLERAVRTPSGADAGERKRRERLLQQIKRWWEMLNGRV